MKRRLPLTAMYRHVPLASAPPRACRECPWRFSNHGNPERFGGNADAWTNRMMLEDGGRPAPCHMTGEDVADDVPIQRTMRSVCCAGITAVQQRAIIRYLLDGDMALPDDVREALLARFVKQPIVDREAAARRLIARAHPGVFDAELGCRAVPAPTEAEVTRWRALAAVTA